MERLESSLKTNYSGQAAAQWLELRLQLLGCSVVAGVALIAVIQHHITGADPGMVGLAISYALGITGKLSGLVSSFTETERELVAVERCGQYIEQVRPEQSRGSITSPYNWPSEGVITMKQVSMRYQEQVQPVPVPVPPDRDRGRRGPHRQRQHQAARPGGAPGAAGHHSTAAVPLQRHCQGEFGSGGFLQSEADC